MSTWQPVLLICTKGDNCKSSIIKLSHSILPFDEGGQFEIATSSLTNTAIEGCPFITRILATMLKTSSSLLDIP